VLQSVKNGMPVSSAVTEIIGGIAAATTTFCWLPQALHIIRTKETAGISAIAYAAFSFGILCWFTYGVLLGSLPLILGNTITLILALTILFMKLYSLRKQRAGS
jgi:MtN3 and saliva related transmembrane protein